MSNLYLYLSLEGPFIFYACFELCWLLLLLFVIAGNAKFASHVKEMLGFYPGWWWRMCWKFISPAIIFVSD